MRTPKLDGRFTPDYRSESWRTLVACGLWMRAGFVGASAVAIAVAMLLAGDAAPLNALASAVAAGGFTAYAWRRSWVVLSEAESAEPARSATARPVGFGDRAESAASH